MVLTALMVPVLLQGAKAAHAPRKSCKIVTRTIKKNVVFIEKRRLCRNG